MAGGRVVATLGGHGGYAELAVADVAELIRVPDTLAISDAAALLADGRTALGLVRGAEPRPGEWALVEATAGGVGGLQVQLLHDADDRVRYVGEPVAIVAATDPETAAEAADRHGSLTGAGAVLLRTRNELVRAGFDHAGKQLLADITAANPTTLIEYVRQWLPLDERRERRARIWLDYATVPVVGPVLATASARLDGELRCSFMDHGLTEQDASQLFALINGVAVQ